MGFSYSPELLLSVKNSKTVSNIRLSPTIFSKLRKLGISNVPKTKRGYAGGRNKTRPIPVHTTNREVNDDNHQKQRGVCHSNLTLVPIQQNSSIKTIDIVTGHRPDTNITEQHGVTHDNLITVKSAGRNSTEHQSHEKSKTKLTSLNFALLNAHSVRNKTSDINQHISDNDLDIVAFTETWLRGDDSDQKTIGELCPAGYKFLHVPRPSKDDTTLNWGGVGILYKASLDIALVKNQDRFRSFEYMEVLFNSKPHSYRVIILYRPPPSEKNGLENYMFWEEFPNFADSKSMLSGQLLLVGDFNFHMDKPEKTDPAKLNSFLSSGNLKQHVSEPTHELGHILDLVITKSEKSIVENFLVKDTMDSDHFWVYFDLPIKKPLPLQKEIFYRKHKNIDKKEFSQDIQNSELHKNPAKNISDAVDQYNETLKNLYDKHAPLKSKVVTIRPNTPWYNQDIKMAKQERKKAERKWRKTKLLVDREIYIEKKRNVNKLIDKAKKDFYAGIIAESSKDQKKLFKVVDSLLHNSKETPLPSYESPEEMANRFADFFIEKIVKIRENLAKSLQNDVQNNPDRCPPKCPVELSTLEPASEDEIKKLIMSSSTKSCNLDPIPTWLLKECIDSLIPVLTRIVNLSLSSAEVPSNLKEAIVLPLLKKLILNPEILKNFRPVSNLSFLSKLIERVADARLEKHISQNQMHEKWQSSYKKFHSTETALLRVMNDVLCDIDNKRCVLLVLLDLSAAFDTIDHTTLLDRLSSRFGVKAQALSWFESYLTGRTQSVLIGNSRSEKCNLDFGVPQGSILGPKQFIGYSAPLAEIVKAHGLKFHLYADDTQLHLAFEPIDDKMNIAIEQLEDCIADIRSWMAKNFLKLNDDKTEFLILGTHRQLKKLSPATLHIGESEIQTTDSARNIGAIFDANMNMVKHVDTVCKSAWYHLRRIGSIRKYLDMSSTKTLVHAFISSKLDNLNSLLYGLPGKLLHKLQRVQNAAARLVTRTKKFDHITPVLKQLHWLPVKERIDYKVLLLTYKALNGQGPAYIKEMLIPCTGPRSRERLLLQIPVTKLVTYGDRAFSKAAPKLWNAIPVDIRHSKSTEIFKKSLKTYLFKQAYNQ